MLGLRRRLLRAAQLVFALGLVCLGSSAFNSFAFTYFIVGTGAWASHAAEYWTIQVLWAPLLALFFWLYASMSQLDADEADHAGERSPSGRAGVFGGV